jgi:aspartyl-tRNA(Asn)/glutamyl-tRNA(Gln) amidotransferase subunit A
VSAPEAEAAGGWLALSAAIREGRADAGAAVDRARAAIAARNPALNAIVDYDPADAEPQIEALRARLARGERPPLAGLPATVKDHIHVRGWRATEGSLLRRDARAAEDDPAVARLRAAGAIFVGRTNMSEFGCKGVTTNLLYGPTGHPADPRLTPGGSSGGAASAVVAGLCAIALASDGGGSIRRPAAHVGAVGFKPSTGAVPNPRGLSHTAVIGLMAMEPATVRAAFAAIRGADARDPVSVDFPDPDGDRAGKPRRLAWAPTLGLESPLDPDADRLGAEAAALLADRGWDVTAAAPDWPSGACEDALMPLQHAALAAAWEAEWRADAARFDPDIAVQIEAGLSLPGRAVAAADALSRGVAGAAARFFADGPDLLLSLTTPCAAWPHDRLGPAEIGGVPVGPRAHAALTPLLNHAFLPAVSIPLGETAGGLPLGLQITGPRFADARVLDAASDIAALLSTR